MTDRLIEDARNLKKLMREAEALADESMIAFSRLKQAMLKARQHPAYEVTDGQAALMRLNQAESQAMAMSTNLLRVHDELSKVSRVRMPNDTDTPTNIPPEAVADAPVPAPAERVRENA